MLGIFLQKSQTKMDLLYSSPLALTFQYLSRWFYKETPLRNLFKEFFEADRRNVDLGYDSKTDEAEDYDFVVGKKNCVFVFILIDKLYLNR